MKPESTDKVLVPSARELLLSPEKYVEFGAFFVDAQILLDFVDRQEAKGKKAEWMLDVPMVVVPLITSYVELDLDCGQFRQAKQ